MKYRQREFGRSFDVDLTPMIDMTFQLIAFFMFVISFSEADQNERIRLPLSELAKPPEATTERPITLQLTREGTVLYSGDEVPLAGMGEKLAIEKDFLIRTDRQPKDATIVIRADAEAQGGDVRRLIKLCQDQTFENFVLRAKEDQR